MATNLRLLFRWLFALLAVVLLLQISGYLSALHRVLRLPSNAEHPVVDLGYATYRGEYVYGRYTRFLGLRYAAPPLGSLRWRSPAPPPVLSGIQQATSPPAQCPQGMLGTRRVNPFIEASHSILPHARRTPVNGDTSEDCLLLNVYAPLDFAGKALPVIVFIHGGGYLGGRGDASGQDLLEESDDGVVVVAIQYRLGIFGFLAGQAIKDSGALNAGLLDQQAALQWVQTHISQFGGDPARVTLWGQSAGAGSVLQQVIANDGKTSPPLFKRSIASSAYMPSQYLYNDPIPEFWYRKVVESAGCSSASDTLSCLRHRPTHELQRVNAEMTGLAMEGTANFVPVVDGSFIKNSPVNALSQGKTNGDAMLVTTLTNEALQFVPPDPRRTIEDYVRGMYPHLSDKNVQEAVQLYSSFGGQYRGTVAVVNESIFLCAAYHLLKAFSGRAWK
ncbi:alpha/beta-hydrolase [Cylindrobasidium torrendii FP15055 ss-10]|uniref:Carboxylic ester hydrolase n=1 Tax=Cylindrobasidium torrendii FP15055 ss-10 TaxID=1314674 RepID=A0A0D7AWJ1_9AGAR|nr:alpha/beta-hydrolase [Cylindrobasidium torrendii FP15055 ss-10]